MCHTLNPTVTSPRHHLKKNTDGTITFVIPPPLPPINMKNFVGRDFQKNDFSDWKSKNFSKNFFSRNPFPRFFLYFEGGTGVVLRAFWCHQFSRLLAGKYYRVTAKMALEILGYTMCEVQL